MFFYMLLCVWFYSVRFGKQNFIWLVRFGQNGKTPLRSVTSTYTMMRFGRNLSARENYDYCHECYPTHKYTMVRFDKNLSAEKSYNYHADGCHCECCSTSTHYTMLHFDKNLSVENYTIVDDRHKNCSTSTQCCVLTETCLGRKMTLLSYFLFWEFKMVRFDRKLSGRNYNYVDDHSKCFSISTQWCFLAGSAPESVTILPDDSFQPTPKRGM